VKRWGKSPPLQAQARRHGKPHRVQGQIGDHGAARSSFRESGMGPGYWLLRQMILSSEHARGRQNSAYSPSKISFEALAERTERRKGACSIIAYCSLPWLALHSYLWACITAAGLALPFRSMAVTATTTGSGRDQARSP